VANLDPAAVKAINQAGMKIDESYRDLKGLLLMEKVMNKKRSWKTLSELCNWPSPAWSSEMSDLLSEYREPGRHLLVTDRLHIADGDVSRASSRKPRLCAPCPPGIDYLSSRAEIHPGLLASR
jgi:hypothetical protein